MPEQEANHGAANSIGDGGPRHLRPSLQPTPGRRQWHPSAPGTRRLAKAGARVPSPARAHHAKHRTPIGEGLRRVIQGRRAGSRNWTGNAARRRPAGVSTWGQGDSGKNEASDRTYGSDKQSFNGLSASLWTLASASGRRAAPAWSGCCATAHQLPALPRAQQQKLRRLRRPAGARTGPRPAAHRDRQGLPRPRHLRRRGPQRQRLAGLVVRRGGRHACARGRRGAQPAGLGFGVDVNDARPRLPGIGTWPWSARACRPPEPAPGKRGSTRTAGRAPLHTNHYVL